MVRVLDVGRWFKGGVVSPLLCGVLTKEAVPYVSTHPGVYGYRQHTAKGNSWISYPGGWGRGVVQVEILLVASVEPFWFECDLTYTVLQLTFNQERK